MSYLSRQQRLASMLGADHPGYVFQVFAGYLVQSLSQNFINELAESRGIEQSSLSEKPIDFPEVNIGLHTFNDGSVSRNGGTRMEWQLLYTSEAYSAQAVDARMKEDVQEVEKAYKDLKAKLASDISIYHYDHDTGEGHQFNFLHRIAEYSFEHHPPREMGVLKACTLIPDVIIQPEQPSVTGLKPILNP